MRRVTAARLAVAFSIAVGVVAEPAMTGPAPQPRIASKTTPRIEIVVKPELQSGPIDGRLLLIIARPDTTIEPRFQVRREFDSPPLFGLDLQGLRPGRNATLDPSTRGWPVESLADIPKGDYRVQAVLNVYTTFHRADGHTIKAHMDQWEGQQWNQSPGNLYSEPSHVHLDPASSTSIRLTLSKRVSPIPPPTDTKYVKHIKFKSEILSRWWGRDIHVGAVVVLPEGFDDHPTARYPVAYNHGHFPITYPFLQESGTAAMRFLADWKSGKLGRFLIVLMQHPTPFYDNSYAVNSANNGPYGDALTQELIPRVEKQFRAIGEPWARVLYGSSTGGWESLAWQVFYPDMFNGTWSFCPDPVDFQYFQLVNIYRDANAFHPNGHWNTEPIRPWMRRIDNEVLMSQKSASRLEAVLGTRGRSGEQIDMFMATYGPVGPDGYPKLLYDKWTGVIDRSVAEYWREHYDLRHILQRDWKTLGPKVVGKLHLYMGDTDSYFLEEAVFLLQEFLESTRDPYYAGSFEIGKRQTHCYAGIPDYPGQMVEQRILPEMLKRILKAPPPGADITSWRY